MMIYKQQRIHIEECDKVIYMEQSVQCGRV
jgi:hypothetical protein